MTWAQVVDDGIILLGVLSVPGFVLLFVYIVSKYDN